MSLFFCFGTNLCLAKEYVNERYGFAVNWQDGDFSAAESNNEDGIIVTFPRFGMEMRAWGSRSWSVLGMNFEDGLQEVYGWFSHISTKNINKEEGWFVLSGSAENSILHVKGFYTPETVCLLSLRYSQEKRKFFDDKFAPEAVRSFRKVSAGKTPVLPPSDNHLLRVKQESSSVDEHGCSTFVFTAGKSLNFLLRKARWDDKSCKPTPGEILRKIALKKGEACRVRFLVPEGMPQIMVCADDTCGTPEFSGMDGSLLLGPGFAEASSSDAPSQVIADLHYLYGNEDIVEIK